jgi:hypothetical protein
LASSLIYFHTYRLCELVFLAAGDKPVPRLFQWRPLAVDAESSPATAYFRRRYDQEHELAEV